MSGDLSTFLRAIEETAELRGDVMALWQRLGEVLDILTREGGYMAAEDQAVLRNARQLHERFSVRLAVIKGNEPTRRDTK